MVEHLSCLQELNMNDFEILEEGDDSGQGQIFVATYQGREVIIKKFKQNKESNRKEIEMYTKLKHPMMVKFYGYFLDEEEMLNIVIEYAEGCQLDDLLVDDKLNDREEDVTMDEQKPLITDSTPSTLIEEVQSIQ